MEEGYITGVDIKHYLYCPLIVYYNYSLHFYERVTEAMEKGDVTDKEAVLNFIYPSLKPLEVIRKPYLYSESLRISGVPDFVLRFQAGHYSVLEVKDTEKANRDHKVQVYFYSLLLEENGYRVGNGYIYYTGLKRLVKVPYTSEERKEVIKFIKKVKRAANGYRPRVRQLAVKCENCGYRKFCVPKIEGKIAYA
ncbi:MAG: CRISPR-associated protein Cas4 [Sulfolobus sp.]|nr:CRISPR-associated protein Cas4 [Sulfolobus sp.]